MLIRKVDKRIQQYLNFLDKKKYSTILKPEVFVGETKDYNYSIPTNMKTSKITFPFTYGKEKYNFWFFITFEIPESYKSNEIYLYAPTGADSLVFINSNPVGAVNPFHLKLKIQDSEKNNPISVAIEAYAGHVIPGYHPDHDSRVILTLGSQIQSYPITFPTCEVLIKNKLIYKLFYDVKVLYEIASELDDNSLRKNEILRDLYYTLIEMHFVSDQETLEKETAIAEKKLQALLTKHNSSTTVRAFAIGHAHIDHAWLWPLGETVRKVARTFSNMTRLADEFPDFTFIQSQPAQMEFLKNHYPFIFDKVLETYKRGQWEPNGGMYVESDTNIPSAESLIRQFLIGKSLTEEYFNYYGDTLWLPDVFGYSANLPQILKGCGIKYFVTSKISWNDTTRFPYETFNWSGIDGSIIPSHFLTTSYEGFVSIKALNNSWNRFQHKEVQNSFIKPFGEGDGGGGPTRHDNEFINRIHDLEGAPNTTWSKVSDSLHEIFASAHHLPIWQGELYLELHRGTYTTIANTKKYNRLIEFLLRDTEFFSVLCTPEVRKIMGFKEGRTYPKEKLNNLWKKLLTHQFHDIIPGSSINQVNVEALAVYESVIEELQTFVQELSRFYQSEESGKLSLEDFIILNTLSWDFTSMVSVPVALDDKTQYISQQNNETNACQIYIDFSQAKHLKTLVQLSALSFSGFEIQKGTMSSPNNFIWKDNNLETPFYKVEFTTSLQIKKLSLKHDNFNYVAPEQLFNTLQFAEDMPVTWDAWDIEWDTFNHKLKSLLPESSEVVATGPLFFQIRYKYTFSNSEIMQDVIFYSHDERIDFKTKVSWHEDHKVLRVIFPSTIFSDVVSCEIQNGHIQRSTLQNRDHERAMFEICAHKWIKLDDSQRGIALLNNSKYGHNVTRNQLGLTLLRSPKHPDEYADIGDHSFTYAIIPYKNKPLSDIIHQGYQLNFEPIIFNGLLSPKYLNNALFNIDNPAIISDSVKFAEKQEGWIIRLYESTGSTNKAKITFYTTMQSVSSTNMVETEEEVIKTNAKEIIIGFTAFEIKTLLLKS